MPTTTRANPTETEKRLVALEQDNELLRQAVRELIPGVVKITGDRYGPQSAVARLYGGWRGVPVGADDLETRPHHAPEQREAVA